MTVIVPRPWGEKYFLASRSNVATIISPKKLLLSRVLSIGAHLSLCSIMVAEKKKRERRSIVRGKGGRDESKVKRGTFGKTVLHIRLAGSGLINRQSSEQNRSGNQLYK